jgi:hypothetical protein
MNCNDELGIHRFGLIICLLVICTRGRPLISTTAGLGSSQRQISEGKTSFPVGPEGVS